MPGRGRKTITQEEIQKVHNCIEQCLTEYMPKKEAEKALFTRHKIEPRFTETIWQLLEQENQEFFKEYYKRLALKEQIEVFNELLSQQAALMRQQGFSNVASRAIGKRPNMPSMHHQLAAGGIMENTGPVLMPENAPLLNSPSSASLFNNCGSSVNPWIQTPVGLYSHASNTDVSGRMMLEDSSKGEMADPSDLDVPALINSNSSYFPYDVDTSNTVFQTHSVMYDQSHPVLCGSSLPSSSGMECDSQNLNGGVNLLHGSTLDDFCNGAGIMDNCALLLPQDMSNSPVPRHTGEHENQGDIMTQQAKRNQKSRFQKPW